MRCITKCVMVLTPVLALATPALAFPPAGLSDSQQPGSVLVFPKFAGGDPGVQHSLQQVQVDTIPNQPRTEIEIGAVCPPLAEFVEGVVSCAPHQVVTVHGHWVCPGFQGVNSQICREEDFTFTLTTNGKVAFSADGSTINNNTPSGIPAPPCPRGYLIAWVVSNTNNAQPVKFDGLIGTAIIRGPDLATTMTSTAVSAYPAITIQAADPAQPTYPATGSNIAGPTLVFDGSPGHYAQVTGALVADVTFDRLSAGTGPAPAVLGETYINLVTLDVQSNRPNNPTSVRLSFYNESANTGGIFGGGEHETSSSMTFVCWTQLGLTTVVNIFLGDGRPGIATPPIDSVLNQNTQSTRKGIVIAGPAQKLAEVDSDLETGPVTLLGLIESNVGTVANMFQERKINYLMGTDGDPQGGAFVP